MSETEDSSIARLIGVVQNYEWGVKGAASLVAASHAANCKHLPASAPPVAFDVEAELPYAELWFGTHPNGCSKVIPIDPEGPDSPPSPSPSREPRIESLYEWLKKGETSDEGSCPYLFKVLSIAKPLSLQLHPDEENAKALHEAHPDIYRDPYDKPEMAMAISNPFEAFCGFRKLKEIIALAGVVPAFGELLQNPLGRIEDPEDEEKCLKTLLSNLYSMSEEKVRERIEAIVNSSIYTSLTDEVENEGYWDAAVKTVLSWFGQDQATTNMTVKAHHLFKRLHEAFPYDRGCFAPFFLNYVKLKPGECIFLAPNTIHAYIQGNCLECMKCSDNVVRAGLTPKFQDIETLKRLVDYRSLSISHSIVKSYEVTCKIVTSGMAAMVTNKSSLKAYIPPITDSFRYYLLRLTTATKAPDIPLPQWFPLMVFVIHGRVKLNQTSSVNPGMTSYTTLGAGSALVVKEWDVLGIDNPSKSWRDGEKMHYVDMMTVDPSSLQEGTNTEGDAVILFVLPNIEPSKLKRSKESRITSKKGSIESKELSNDQKASSSEGLGATPQNAENRSGTLLNEGAPSSGVESQRNLTQEAAETQTSSTTTPEPRALASSFAVASQATGTTANASTEATTHVDTFFATPDNVFKSPESLEKESKRLESEAQPLDSTANVTDRMVSKDDAPFKQSSDVEKLRNPESSATVEVTSTLSQTQKGARQEADVSENATRLSGSPETAHVEMTSSLSQTQRSARQEADVTENAPLLSGSPQSAHKEITTSELASQHSVSLESAHTGTNASLSSLARHSGIATNALEHAAKPASSLSQHHETVNSFRSGDSQYKAASTSQNPSSADKSPRELVPEVAPAVAPAVAPDSKYKTAPVSNSSGGSLVKSPRGEVSKASPGTPKSGVSQSGLSVSHSRGRPQVHNSVNASVRGESSSESQVKMQAVSEGASIGRSPRTVAPAVTPSVVSRDGEVKMSSALAHAVREPTDHDKEAPIQSSQKLRSTDYDVTAGLRGSEAEAKE